MSETEINELVAEVMELYVFKGQTDQAMSTIRNRVIQPLSLSHPLHATVVRLHGICKEQCRRKQPGVIEVQLKRFAGNLSALVAPAEAARPTPG